MNDACPNSFLGYHKFEPRYDLGPSTWTPERYIGFRASENMDAYRTKTYVRDVCVRCGKTIERVK